MNYDFIEDIEINYFSFFFLVIPSRPMGPLAVTDVQRNSISIKWKPPTDDGGSPLTGYIVEKRPEENKYWSKVEKVNKDTTELCVQNLREKTLYHFRVIAENKIGESEPLITKDATMAKSPFGNVLMYFQIFF